MTARPLPEAVERRLQAALLDAYNHGWAVGARVKAPVGPDNHEAALRAAIAAAMAPGEPVAWALKSPMGRLYRKTFPTWEDAEGAAQAIHDRDGEGARPTVVPLYTRPAATGDTGEVQRARAAFYEAAREAQEIAVEAASQLPLSGEEQAAVAEARKKRSDAYRALIKAERAATGGPDSGQGGVGSE